MSTPEIDAVPMAPPGDEGDRDPIRRTLDELLTHAFYSAAGYVFESDPYAVPEDDSSFAMLAALREDDRRHAHILGALIQVRGGVPSPGVFPWWNLDLNYLSVPCAMGFVVGTLEDELKLYDRAIARWPKDDGAGRAALQAIRNDKAGHHARLKVAATEALAREAAAYADKIAARKKAKAAKLAKEKAAAEAARKAKMAGPAKPAAAPAAAAKPAAPSAAMLDPNEPGISPKEKGRRTVLRMRAGGAAPAVAPAPGAPPAPSAASAAAPKPAAAAAPPAAAGGELLDPNEPGISPKEKGRRQVMRSRAASAPAATSAASAPAPAAAAPAGAAPAAVAPAAGAELLDPNEPGISPKEKGRRQVMKARAASAPSGGGASAAAPAAAPAAPPSAPAQAAAAAAPVIEDAGDPDEPGISPKEKGRRQVMRMRAKKAAGG